MSRNVRQNRLGERSVIVASRFRVGRAV